MDDIIRPTKMSEPLTTCADCQTNKDCSQAALDRLEDAIALYNSKRYHTAIYLAGYVIELGIKADLHRLKDLELDNEKFQSIITHLFAERQPDKSAKLKEWKYPQTLNELLIFIYNIAEYNKGSGLALHNYIKESPVFSAILNNRSVPTPNTDKGAKETSVQNKGETFHNIEAFLTTLCDWRHKMGETKFGVSDFRVDTLYGWGTGMRYAKSDSGDNTDEAIKHKAEKILGVAAIFLIEVVKIKLPADVMAAFGSFNNIPSFVQESESVNSKSTSVNLNKE